MSIILNNDTKNITIPSGINPNITIDFNPDDYYSKLEINQLLETKQNELVSGENIKTYGGRSILGSGDLLHPMPNEIWYTSSDGAVVTPHDSSAFGATIVSNTYENGRGVIKFDGEVKEIGNSAFLECKCLTSVSIPDSVIELGSQSFKSCYALLNFRNSANLESIGDDAFRNCTTLNEITIPDGVVKIGAEAFYACRSLKSITFPDSVEEIGDAAISRCDSLVSINGKFASANHDLLIVNGVLIGHAHQSTLDIVIPETVTSIGYTAFYDCDWIKSITLPNSLTSIGDYAFGRCTSLKSVTIPNSVTSIGIYAFQNCTSLTSVTIPNGITSIGGSAFSGCAGELFLNGLPYEDYEAVISPIANGWLKGSNFSKITIGSSVSSIGKNTFYNYAGELEIASKALVETDNTSTTIPANSGWLMGTKIHKITISNNITRIGSRAFALLSSLKEVVLPNSVTSIGAYSFNQCSSLQKITFGNSLTTLENGAFKACQSLKSITFPDSFTSIGRYAFQNCTALKTIYCKDMIPPTIQTSSFTDTAMESIVVPLGSLSAYKIAPNWASFANIIYGSEYLTYSNIENFPLLLSLEQRLIALEN